MIEQAELEKIKCFEFECENTSISQEKVKTILIGLGEEGLWAKYERFRDKKELDGDPLVRYCTKAGCDGHMRGESLESTTKL